MKLVLAFVFVSACASRGDIAPGERLPDASVVALSHAPGEAPFCSGSLVARDFVVTAAHCETGLPIQVFFGEDAREAGTWREVYEARVHPDFSWTTLAADLALLRLAQPAPTELEPIGLAADAPATAETVWLTGFGYSQPRFGGTYGLRTTHEARITRVDSTTFGYGVGTCEGDSGGAAFVARSGSFELAGITSTGDPACADHGTDTRVDVYLGWLESELTNARRDVP